MAPSPNYRTAIYARVSTKDRQDARNQLRELRALCKRDPELSLAGEYVDQESGGAADRPEFRRLFEDAHRRKFDLVLFWALDRFSREGALATLNHLRELESYGVGFRSFTERYLDSTGIFKEAIVALLATLAKQERLRLSERVKAGMERARAEGKRISRPSLSIEAQAQIRALLSAGHSQAAVARELKLSRATVQKYLPSPTLRTRRRP
jgi:DNA invertase Pin-like site-specific DNA recombinase